MQATCSTLDNGIQTVLKCEDMVRCESVVLQLKSPQMCTEDYFSSKDDAFIKFYTGLPKVVFDFVAPPISRIHKLNSFQEFLVVMMKLRQIVFVKIWHIGLRYLLLQYLVYCTDGFPIWMVD